MKISGRITLLILCLTTLMGVTGCDENVVDFGFDGALSGTVVDENGNIVAGDITSNNLVLKALGEGDQVTTDIRVQGDGTFQHTKLYPKPYKIWLEGPVTLVTDTLVIDFSEQKTVAKDLVVIPYVSFSTPVAGSPGESATIDYSMSANEGKVISKRELYCSTVPYPSGSTGSGPFFETIEVQLDTDAGTATVEGLAPQTKYFIRIGAQTTDAGFNYSEQIVITTP